MLQPEVLKEILRDSSGGLISHLTPSLPNESLALSAYTAWENRPQGGAPPSLPSLGPQHLLCELPGNTEDGQGGGIAHAGGGQ